MPSFGLVVRLQWCEAPYLNEYLAYYRKLGVNHFYLINTEPECRSRLEAVVKGHFKTHVTIIDLPAGQKVFKAQNLALPLLKQDYVLSLDMDEFLFTHGRSLSWIVQRMPGSIYMFRWLMMPSAELYTSSIMSLINNKTGFASHEHKVMVKCQHLEELKEHNARLKGRYGRRISFNQYRHQPFIIHVAARGVYDVFNRLLNQRFNDGKNIKLDSVSQNDWNSPANILATIKDPQRNFDKLPARLRVLALQCDLKDAASFKPKANHLGQTTDLKLLRQITLDSIRKLDPSLELSNLDHFPAKLKRICQEQPAQRKQRIMNGSIGQKRLARIT